ADIARDEGLGLSPEEAAKCADTAQRLTGQRDFTPEDMEQVLIMRMLSSKAYNYELSLQDIDEEAVIGAIDASAYTAYEVDYLYVPFYIFSGSDEKREECCSELNGMRDFSGDYAEAARYRSGFQAGCLTLCPSLGDSDPILLRAAQALQIGEVSDVIITDYGLFMLRLKDDSDTSLYEAAVDDALLSARKSAYQAEFNRLFASAEYTLNALYWDTLQP
ncbi:MAG: hypothetical protein II920_08280, partial [Clostridia bacterium]|nr:hypothetical protein [Clostridia bacterium]